MQICSKSKIQYLYLLVILLLKGGHIRRRGKVHTGFWWGNLSERDHLYNLCKVRVIISSSCGVGAQDGKCGYEPSVAQNVRKVLAT